MKPEPGVRLTVIAREPHTPYSGMLPGYVAGQYTWDEIHIDLVKLSTYANARFVTDEATGIDSRSKKVQFASRPPLRYDTLSINAGGQPGQQFQGHPLIVPVKPIGQFIPRWNAILEQSGDKEGKKLLIVGGGPGSVELALAISERYGRRFQIDLITADSLILAQHSQRVRRNVLRALHNQDICIRTSLRVKSATDCSVIAEDGETLAADFVLWVAGVEAPKWVQTGGLALDSVGFIRVDKNLRSVSHPNIFAAGDIASLDGQERPKSGVFAVREGPILARNLRACAIGKVLKVYRAQRKALAILRVRRNCAISSKGAISIQGSLVWAAKDWIDRRFMRSFSNDLNMMASDNYRMSSTLRINAPNPMRCGGCGAKLGAAVLNRVFRRLSENVTNSALSSEIGDDAAVWETDSSRIVMSCDMFRAMVSDPWRFGRISAHHALNDLYAMGCHPKVALVIVTIPAMAPDLMEEDLYQTMCGALAVFDECRVTLVGGHSSEGHELALGFTVGGSSNQALLSKDALRSGQSLVITKSLGTGVLLAGLMRGQVSAKHIVTAVNVMDRSNASAARILVDHGATACTDITGFGLLGHLSEMVRASRKHVTLNIEDIKAIDGAISTLEKGVESSLQRDNELVFADYQFDTNISPSMRKLLVDPQTAGGLLASIPSDKSDKCVEALIHAGYAQAARIGFVSDTDHSYVSL